jgi:hypothetical protein
MRDRDRYQKLIFTRITLYLETIIYLRFILWFYHGFYMSVSSKTGYRLSFTDFIIVSYRDRIEKEDLVVELGEGKNMQVPSYASLHKTTQPKPIHLLIT